MAAPQPPARLNGIAYTNCIGVIIQNRSQRNPKSLGGHNNTTQRNDTTGTPINPIATAVQARDESNQPTIAAARKNCPKNPTDVRTDFSVESSQCGRVSESAHVHAASNTIPLTINSKVWDVRRMGGQGSQGAWAGQQGRSDDIGAEADAVGGSSAAG